MKLSIATDFPSVTGLRHSAKSEKSGEEFYHTLLNPRFIESLQSDEVLELDLDGTLDSYAPSFLDESIGNLVYDFSLAIVRKWLRIQSIRNPSWLRMIEEETFIQWEKKRLAGESRRISVCHEDWYHRNTEGQYEKGQWATLY